MNLRPVTRSRGRIKSPIVRRLRLPRCLFAFLFWLIPATVALAQGPTWRSIGPPGGSIFSFVIDPTNPARFYAGTYAGGAYAGAFNPLDGTTTWSPINADLPPSTSVFALAVDPASSSTLYAGTWDTFSFNVAGGVFKSVNSGANWTAAKTGLPDSVVYALAIDPAAHTTLYAGTSGYGVFKSTDGAGTWNAVSSGLTDLGIRALAIDPSTPTTLYAGTISGGVFKTIDGGLSWGATNTGLNNHQVNSLAVNPSTPTTLYAGTNGGVFRSTNGGASWGAANTALSTVYAVAIDASTPTKLYAGTNGGVFKSTDGGVNWTAVNAGFGDGAVLALGVDPTSPSVVYAATQADTGSRGSMFKSTNAGGSWSAINSGLTNTFVNGVVVDPVTPTTLYAVTASTGVFKTTDSGRTWIGLGTGLLTSHISSLAIDPFTPTTLYAAPLFPSVSKSIDGGETWSALDTPPSGYVVVDPVTPRTVYASAQRGFIKSTDGGLNWVPLTTGGCPCPPLAIDPKTPSILYAAGAGGAFARTASVFKSTDHGGTWTEHAIGAFGSVRALVIDPTTPTTLYAGTDLDGVFKTTDAGITWRTANTGLIYQSITALAVDPATSTTVYAGADGGGVFQSTDAGATWNPINTGLTSVRVTSLAVDPKNPSIVYAGTPGSGVATTAAGPQPPGTPVPVGSNIVVQIGSVTLTFLNVTQAGKATVSTSSAGAPPPSGFSLGDPARYVDISTTASFSGFVEVCINYSGITFTSPPPRLFHLEGGTWVDVTTSVDATSKLVCGRVNSLSPFALFQSTDKIAPTVACMPVLRLKNDDDEELLFRVTATDSLSGVSTIALGGFQLSQGEVIQIQPSRRPGVRLIGKTDDHDDDSDRLRIRRFRVGPGEAIIRATDAAGNVGTAVCPLPRAREDNDGRKRDGRAKGQTSARTDS